MENADENLFVFDLNKQESQLIGSVPLNCISKIRWSGDDTHIILSGKQDGRDQIWIVAASPDSTAEFFQEEAVLIEAIVYPIP